MSNQSATPHPETNLAHARGGDASCQEIVWDSAADCRHCKVRHLALFSSLRGSDFNQFFAPVRSAVLGAGTVLYTQNAAADVIYSVRSGVVKLVKESPEGAPRIVRLLGPGAALGLEALKEGVYWHTAIALDEVGLCRIPFQVIDQLQARNPQIVDGLILQWEQYLVYADRWITELSTGPVKERVHRLIGLLVEITGSHSGEIELPSVPDLAAILGISGESASRAMAELKRNKILSRVAPRTYHCDLEALDAEH